MAKTRSKKLDKRTRDKASRGTLRAALAKSLRPRKASSRVRLHKSFRRSYREDYVRDLEVPGILYHIFAAFKIIFKNWKIFLPLLILVVCLSILFVGLMSEDSYRQFQDILDETTKQMNMDDIGSFAKSGLLLISTITTGGLSGGSSESATVFAVIIFLIIWLTTVFILRHRLAGHELKLRDALYNAATPLISTFVVFIMIIIQCIPLFVLIIALSAAIQTNFLATPFYALVFFIFAMLMIIISSYLLSSSLVGLVAVTAPGMYPMRALRAASDLMAGRRVRFILRLVALFIALAVIWILVMLPLILFDLWMRQFEWTANVPFVPICLLTMTCFTGIYVSTYIYLYYRWMLNYDKK